MLLVLLVVVVVEVVMGVEVVVGVFRFLLLWLLFQIGFSVVAVTGADVIVL